MMAPYLIFALPRSRTAWLAHFLTYRDWTCLHEHAIQVEIIAHAAVDNGAPASLDYEPLETR
jgi:hypothetical protein